MHTTTQDKINLQLKDFGQPIDGQLELYEHERGSSRRIDRKQFPAPALLRFLLQGVCKFPSGYLDDKMRWIIHFSYKGKKCAIADLKFGMRFYSEDPCAAVNPDEVLGKLQKALGIFEREYLSNFANEQMKKGNVTISNHFLTLNDQYEYFRGNAVDAYTSTQKAESEGGDIINFTDLLATFTSNHNRNVIATRQGQHNALAMIDAYFSRLEHLLVLALPFANYDRKKDDLATFVGYTWSKKVARILKPFDEQVQKHHQNLLQIKEKYRNTFAHGGFEKNGQSFSFHLGGYAVPVSMSGVRDSVHFNNISIDEAAFEYICSVFDAFDQHLSQVAIPAAWKYAGTGFDLPLDESYLQNLLTVCGHEEDYDDFLTCVGYKLDQYINVDY